MARALVDPRGAALGAWLRWVLGIFFNPVLPTLPLGTLSANLAGGYVIGIAVEYLSRHAGLPPEVRLLVITGFLGGLTTFSTFSAEATALIQAGQTGWALVRPVAAAMWLAAHYPPPATAARWLTLDEPVQASRAIADVLTRADVAYAVTGQVASCDTARVLRGAWVLVLSLEKVG